MGSMASSFAGMGGGSMPTGMSVMAAGDDAPPAGFFEPLGADGYFDAPARFAGETVRMRMMTLNDNAVIPEWLQATTLLGQLRTATTTYAWSVLSSEAGRSIPMDQIMSYIATNGQNYSTPESLWEYISWSEIGPQMTSQAQSFFPSFPPFSRVNDSGDWMALTSTEARTNWAMGGMSGFITKSTTTESMFMNMTVVMTYDATVRHAIPYYNSGSGIMTREGETNTMSVSQFMNSAGLPISGTMEINTSDGYTMSLSINLFGSMEGTIIITTSEVAVGTIFINNDGSGLITAEGNTYPFSGPGH
jgi:hypothetical protein